MYFWRSWWHFFNIKIIFQDPVWTFNDLGALFNNWGDFQRSRSHFFRSLFKIDLRVFFRLRFFIFTHALFRISPLFFINIRVFVDPLYLFFHALFSYFELTFKISRQNLHRSTTLSSPKSRSRKALGNKKIKIIGTTLSKNQEKLPQPLLNKISNKIFLR